MAKVKKYQFLALGCNITELLIYVCFLVWQKYIKTLRELEKAFKRTLFSFIVSPPFTTTTHILLPPPPLPVTQKDLPIVWMQFWHEICPRSTDCHHSLGFGETFLPAVS